MSPFLRYDMSETSFKNFSLSLGHSCDIRESRVKMLKGLARQMKFSFFPILPRLTKCTNFLIATVIVILTKNDIKQPSLYQLAPLQIPLLDIFAKFHTLHLHFPLKTRIC